jgi:hypothetical protein
VQQLPVLFVLLITNVFLLAFGGIKRQAELERHDAEVEAKMERILMLTEKLAKENQRISVGPPIRLIPE